MALLTSPRFIVREFTFSEDAIERQREELQAADTTEKELWVRRNHSFDACVADSFIDGASATFTDKLLGGFPDPSASQSASALRGERAAIRSPGTLRRLLYQGKCTPAPFLISQLTVP